MCSEFVTENALLLKCTPRKAGTSNANPSSEKSVLAKQVPNTKHIFFALGTVKDKITTTIQNIQLD